MLVGSENNVRHRQPQAAGLVHPSFAWCFGVARPRFWRLESCNLELVACRFRKQRQAQAAAGRRPGPSFSCIVFRCVANFLSVQKATLAAPKASSVLQLHGVSVWRGHFLVGLENNVRHRQPQAEGLVHPSFAWCFGVARLRFWRLEGCNSELVACRFRKQRQAQAAAGRRLGPSFSCIKFWEA